MWIFNYFFGTFSICSIITTGYDIFVNKGKHYKRTSDETINIIKYIAPNIIFNIILTIPYFELAEIYIETKERNKYGILMNSIFTFFIADFLTYITHRLAHLPRFYKYHKKHHEFKHPISMAAIYADPLDFMLVNVIPFSASIFLIHPDDISIAFLTCLFMSITMLQAHGGYKFLDDAHLNHHIYYKVNYGLGFFDIIFGTKMNT